MTEYYVQVRLKVGGCNSLDDAIEYVADQLVGEMLAITVVGAITGSPAPERVVRTATSPMTDRVSARFARSDSPTDVDDFGW